MYFLNLQISLSLVSEKSTLLTLWITPLFLLPTFPSWDSNYTVTAHFYPTLHLASLTFHLPSLNAAHWIISSRIYSSSLILPSAMFNLFNSHILFLISTYFSFLKVLLGIILIPWSSLLIFILFCISSKISYIIIYTASDYPIPADLGVSNSANSSQWCVSWI